MKETVSQKFPSKRDLNRQDRRDAILKVASASFLNNGYAATSMSAIAAELGGSKATLWSYFPSKEELFEAVIDYRVAVFREQVKEILVPSDDAEATLLCFSKSLIAKVTSPEAIALQRVTIAETNRFPEIGKIYHRNGAGLIRTLLTEFLSDAITRRQSRQVDAEEAASTLVALCISRPRQDLLFGVIDAISDEQIDAQARQAVAHFLKLYGNDLN